SVLRAEPVTAPTETQELASFTHRIGDSDVLYLGSNAYAPWALLNASVSALDPNVISQGRASLRSGNNGLGPLDFGSVDPSDLDRFAYVITSNTPYAAPPPPNFHLVAQRRLYELWQRQGPTPNRQTLDPSAPGAVLNCRTAAGRKLAHRPGRADV